MSANVIAAWIGAVGVVLTWAAKLVSFLLNRRIRVIVRLLEGPKLKVVNRSTVEVDIQPVTWEGRWVICGNPAGVEYVKDIEGDYIKLDPKAELPLAFLPDQGPLGAATLRPESVSRILGKHAEPLYVRRRDGKVLCKVPYRMLKEKLLINSQRPP